MEKVIADKILLQPNNKNFNQDGFINIKDYARSRIIDDMLQAIK
jgi:hypothetical protein